MENSFDGFCSVKYYNYIIYSRDRMYPVIYPVNIICSCIIGMASSVLSLSLSAQKAKMLKKVQFRNKERCTFCFKG